MSHVWQLLEGKTVFWSTTVSMNQLMHVEGLPGFNALHIAGACKHIRMYCFLACTYTETLHTRIQTALNFCVSVFPKIDPPRLPQHKDII